MPFRYLEEVATADVAFEAAGETIEEIFLAAAHATIGVMVEEPGKIDRQGNSEGPEENGESDEICFHLEEQDIEMLLFDFLQEIIYLKDARCLLALVHSVTIDAESNPMRLTARARCQSIASQRQRLLTDVKAVTLHRFGIRRHHHGWTATVVLDV